jgi:diguanylate cyclase (GGDEF)-like protein/PAS domain S-box-containing protein
LGTKELAPLSPRPIATSVVNLPLLAGVKFRIYLAAGFILVSLLLAAVAAVAFRKAQVLILDGKWSSHTESVLVELESARDSFHQLNNVLQEKPTQTQDASDRALGTLRQHAGRIRELTRDNPEQQWLVSRLESEIDATISLNKRQTNLLDPNHGDNPEVKSILEIRDQVQKVFEVIARMRTEEEHLLREHNLRDTRVAKSTLEMISYLAAVGLLVLTLSYWLLTQNLQARERMQKVLGESEALYKDLFDGTNDLIHLISPEGRYLYTNRAWREALGYTEEEIPKLRFEDVVHPEDLIAGRKMLNRLITGEVITNIELRLRAKDGRTINIEGSSGCRYVDGKPFSTRGIYRDVTENKRTDAERARLVSIIEEAPDYIGSATLSGKVQSANRAFRHLRDLPDDADLSHLSMTDVHPEWGIRKILEEAIPAALKSGVWRGENVLLDHKGLEIPVSQIIVVHRNEIGEPAFVSTLCRDITDSNRVAETLQEAQDQLKYALQREQELSRTDALTKVPNRRAFYETLEAERLRSLRYRHSLTVAYIDLDNFKEVNDSLGHAEGDEVLISVAATLRANLRASDFVARIGGDEFAVMLPETNAQVSEAVLQKLRICLLEAMASRNSEVTFSIGAVNFMDPRDPLDTLLQIADGVMYIVKTRGKDGVSVAVVG